MSKLMWWGQDWSFSVRCSTTWNLGFGYQVSVIITTRSEALFPIWLSQQKVGVWQKNHFFQTWEGECQFAKTRISKYFKCVDISTFSWRLFCFTISSPGCFPRAGLAAALWVAMLKQGNALLVSSAAPLTLCAQWLKELGMEEGKKKPSCSLYPERSQGLKTVIAFLYGDA